jgi:hypothetical protein
MITLGKTKLMLETIAGGAAHVGHDHRRTRVSHCDVAA